MTNYIKPFPYFCLQIGVIPSIFDESLSYWDMMSSLVNFLNTEVIPKVNNNTETINQLIDFTNNLQIALNNAIARIENNEKNISNLSAKYNLEIPILRENLNNLISKENSDVQNLQAQIDNLKTYTDNRFDDFFKSPQFENALKEAFDEFFTDDKIKEYLNDNLLNGILEEVKYRPKTYNTLQDVKNDVQNLVADMLVITYGYADIFDNGGSFYRVVNYNEHTNYDDGYYINLNGSLALELIMTRKYITDSQYGISSLSATPETQSLQFKRMLENFKINEIVLTTDEINIMNTININSSKYIHTSSNPTNLKIQVNEPFNFNQSSYKCDYKFEGINFNYYSIPVTDDIKLFNVNYFDNFEIKNCKFDSSNIERPTLNDNFVLFDINSLGNTLEKSLVLDNVIFNIKIEGQTEDNVSKIFNINTETNFSKFELNNIVIDSNNSSLQIVDFENGENLITRDSKFNIENIQRSVTLFNTIVKMSQNNSFDCSATNTNVGLTIFTSVQNSYNDEIFNDKQRIIEVLNFDYVRFIACNQIANYDVNINNLYAIVTSLLNITGRTGNKSFTLTISNSYILQTEYSKLMDISSIDNMMISNTCLEMYNNLNSPFYFNNINSILIFNNVHFKGVSNQATFSPLTLGESDTSKIILNNPMINSDILSGIPQNSDFRSVLKVGTILPANDSTHLGVRKYVEGSDEANWITV